MRRQIACAVVASLLIGSAPGWADGDKAASKPAAQDGARLRPIGDSVDRAVASIPPLTAREREDLEARQAALTTDPVARGTGGIIMALVGTAVSIGLTMYLIKQTKDSTTNPAGMARH